ncbi:MAG: Ig-like domain-containing protein, partial [Nanoarchaeota archaeon]
LYVNATDSFRRVFDRASVHGLRFDNVAPTATLNFPTNGVTVKGTVTINVTASSDAKQVVFEYSNDSGAAWYPIGIDFSPAGGWAFAWYTTALGDASTYRVRANITDYAALSVIAQNTADFTIDNTVPTVTINTPAPGIYVNGTTTINFTGNQTVSSELSIDGAGWANITNSTSFAWNTSAYNDGTHTLQVRNNDSAGNTGLSSIVSVIVDNTRPTPLITYPLSNSTIRGNITVLIIAPSDTTRLEFYVDNSTGSGSGWVLRRTDTNKEDGWSFVWDTGLDCTTASECSGARIRANATDASGLQGNFTVSDLRIDNAGPSVTLLTPADSATVRAAYIVSATSSSDTVQVVFEYSPDSGTTWYTIGIDPSSAGGWNITWDTKAVADGSTYRIRANATDIAKLSGVGQNSADFTVDNLAPGINITVPRPGSRVNGTVNVSFSGGERHPMISIDGKPVINTSSIQNYTWDTTRETEGAHTLRINDSDTSGNVGYSGTVLVFVDNIAGVVSIIRPSRTTAIASGSLEVEVQAPDNTKFVVFNVSNSTRSNMTVTAGSGVTNDTTPLDGWRQTIATGSFAEGLYNITVYAYDELNSFVDDDSITNIRFDNTAPPAPTLSALPAFDTDGTIVLEWSNVTASVSDVAYYNIYRSTNVSFELSSAARIKNVSGNFNSTTDFPGVNAKYYYKVTAVDNALLESAASNEESTTITAAVGAVFGSLAANQTVVRNGSPVLFTFTGNKVGLNV